MQRRAWRGALWQEKRQRRSRCGTRCSQVVTWCYLIALRGVTKWDVHGRDDFLEKAARNAEDYMIRVRAGSSDRAARKWLDSVTEKLAFVLPADKAPKKQADGTSWRKSGSVRRWRGGFCLLHWCVRSRGAARWTKKTAQVVLDETQSVYRRFLDWAVEGDAYGMERLKRDVESVLGEAVEVFDDGRGAVFAKTIY